MRQRRRWPARGCRPGRPAPGTPALRHARRRRSASAGRRVPQRGPRGSRTACGGSGRRHRTATGRHGARCKDRPGPGRCRPRPGWRTTTPPLRFSGQSRPARPRPLPPGCAWRSRQDRAPRRRPRRFGPRAPGATGRPGRAAGKPFAGAPPAGAAACRLSEPQVAGHAHPGGRITSFHGGFRRPRVG